MNTKDILFSLEVGKSALLYGFTLPLPALSAIVKQAGFTLADSESRQVKVRIGNETFSCNFTSVSTQGRVVKRFLYGSTNHPLAKKVQQSYLEAFSYLLNDGVIDREAEVPKEISSSYLLFVCKTDETGCFEFVTDYELPTASPEVMKREYEKYLDGIEGKFGGYINAIDKDFVTKIVKCKYSQSSAYCIADPDIINELVNYIRDDSGLDELDKLASSRAPSCSLKKYAEFLRVYIKKTTTMPFEIPVVIDTISKTGLIFDPKFVERYVCSLLTKPFVILSGLTGSGKTQLAMAFPKMICESKSQYKLIPVGADWTNREQLLGYPNALRKGEYVMPDNGALQLILEASKPENAEKPYFLVLDEMNMSYVERYFADFLSAMESGEEIPLWEGNEDVPSSIVLPKNLFIIGTINVDETTYMFSPKVLDRANVIEFRINKQQMLEYFDGTGTISAIENCSERAADFVASASKEYAGSLSAEMKTTLIDMFDTLGKIQKEFGYRTAHEMSRYITITKCFTEMNDNESIDSAIVQKLLPKVHGSRKKVTPVLKALWAICYNEEAVEIDTLEALPEVSTFKYPLTAEKIWRMFQIAQDNGFTSFAEA